MLRVRTHTRRDRFAHMECCFASRRRSPVRTLGTAVEVRLVPNEPTVVSVVLVSEAEVATRSLYTIPKERVVRTFLFKANMYQTGPV